MNKNMRFISYILVSFLVISALCVPISRVEAYTTPTVGVLTPQTGVVGAEINFQVAALDTVGVRECAIQNVNTSQYLSPYMSLTSGTVFDGVWKLRYVFASPGTYNLKVFCWNMGGYSSYGPTATMQIATAGDTATPVITNINPATVTAGSSVTFTADYSDQGGVTSCSFLLNGSIIGTVAPGAFAQNGTVSLTTTLSSPGTMTLTVQCTDGAGNMGTANKQITVNSAAVGSDATAPTLGIVTPNTATIGTASNFSVTYSDNVGVSRCTFQGPTDVISLATLSGASTNGTASYAYTFSAAGTFSVRFSCVDAAGNTATRSKEVIVSAAPSPSADTTSPTLGVIAPGTAVAGVPTTFTASYSDSVGVTFCEVQRNAEERIVAYRSGADTNGTVSFSYTFASPSNATITFRCRDAAGNTGTASKVVAVSAASSGSSSGGSSGSNPRPASLIKLRCPNYAVASDHPCKAVYYYGQDNRRHAFPNERVYFTWYANFSGVTEVSDSFMASLPLGRLVTYRPGIRLVKFTTVPRVYAVARGGTLRWIATEAVARQLYGSSWNTNVHDVADTFYGTYTLGADITSATQFNATAEAALATNIDMNW